MGQSETMKINIETNNTVIELEDGFQLYVSEDRWGKKSVSILKDGEMYRTVVKENEVVVNKEV